MKIKINDSRSELAKKSDKLIITGTILKILLPGTGIGSLLSANGWLCAIMDAVEHPNIYTEMMVSAGVMVPKSVKLTEDEAAMKVVEFLNRTKTTSIDEEES